MLRNERSLVNVEQEPAVVVRSVDIEHNREGSEDTYTSVLGLLACTFGP